MFSTKPPAKQPTKQLPVRQQSFNMLLQDQQNDLFGLGIQIVKITQQKKELPLKKVHTNEQQQNMQYKMISPTASQKSEKSLQSVRSSNYNSFIQRESLQRSNITKPPQVTNVKQHQAAYNFKAPVPPRRQNRKADQSFDDKQITYTKQLTEQAGDLEEQVLEPNVEPEESQNKISENENLDQQYQQVEEANEQAIQLNDGVKFYHPVVKGKETSYVVQKEIKPRKPIKHVQLGRPSDQNNKIEQRENVQISNTPRQQLQVYGGYSEPNIQVKSLSNNQHLVDENFYLEGKIEGYEMDESQSGLFLNEYISDQVLKLLQWKNRGDIKSRDLSNTIVEEIQYHYQDYYPIDGSEPIPLQNSVNHQNWLIQQQQAAIQPPVQEEVKASLRPRRSQQEQRNDKLKHFK